MPGAITNAARFSVGWYAARGFTLIASCVLLAVLLTEMMVLYSRLTNAIILQRRERANRLMSLDAATAAIAHEVRSPLGAIALNAHSAIAELAANQPNLPEVNDMLKHIEADTHRVEQAIASTRGLFKETADLRVPTQLEEVAQQALALIQDDLETNRVKVETDFANQSQVANVDRSQIQQAALNLLRNSLDAMSDMLDETKLLRLSTHVDATSVRLLVQGPRNFRRRSRTHF